MTRARNIADIGDDVAGGGSLVTTSSPSLGRRNKIINGSMVIDQRNGGSSVTPTSNGTYILDRWRASLSQASKYSVQQNAGSVTPPTGFTNYIGITSTSAYSVLSSDFFMMQQALEGFNVSDLGWGTSSAKAITISFWVRSSLTGTFGGALYNNSGDRSYPFTYTISVADTWEYKTVNIEGETTGTWVTNNGVGIMLNFGLGVGSTYSGTAGSWSSSLYFGATGATSVVGTSGATLYITGVQLEVGSVATPFEHRSYGEELALCQRYYEEWNGLVQYNKARESDRIRYFAWFYKQSKRVPPTLSISNLQDGDSLAIWTDNSVDSFRTQCTAFSDGATPFFTGLTVDAEL